MRNEDRPPQIVLRELAPIMALRATQYLYEEQPELWKLGEKGRAHTLEDFGHHFAALSTLRTETFRAHVEYCEKLFAQRGFPHMWLEDAWRWMLQVLTEELPPALAEQCRAIVRESTSGR